MIKYIYYLHFFLFSMFVVFLYAAKDINTQNNQLLNILYNDEGWVFQETTSNKCNIYVKNIEGLSLNGVKISQIINFNPEKILNIILDTKNYNQILINSPNVYTREISNTNAEVIAIQEIGIPFLTDLYYLFGIKKEEGKFKNSINWTLRDPNLFAHSDQSDYPLTIGCGGWNYIDNNDGSFTINYRLVMDIDGYPACVINYINYYSLVNVFNDVIIAAQKQ